MMDRRSFLTRSAAGAASLALMPGILRECSTPHDPLHDFGIISGLVRDAMKAGHRSAMEQLSAMGYRYLEFGGSFGEDPDELRQFMQGIGLIPLAGGASLSAFQGEGLGKQIEDCLAMGKEYLVCYWPWMTGADEVDAEQVDLSVRECNRIGEECRRNGLRFAFHNHDHEFRRVDGKVIYETILERTDPDLVTMEIDVYWSHKGGADIREYFSRFPGRFELVHVKDSYDSPDRRSFACVGDGILDFADLFSYREVAGFRHLIVENDQPGEDPMGCARSSIRHLQSLEF